MFECLILGDSLAQGTAAALQSALFNRCEIVAKKGAGTDQIARAVPRRTYQFATISAGTNDYPLSSETLQYKLASLRVKIAAENVVWIAPYDRRIAWIVASLARHYGDSLVDVAETPAAPDGLHPQSYRRLATVLGAAGFGGSR